MEPKSEILGRVKIREEDELQSRLLEHPFFRKEVAPLVVSDNVDRYSSSVEDQLRRGTELTRSSYPLLFSLLDKACGTLGLTVAARLFKSNDAGGGENAWVASAADRVAIAFQSGILRTVDRPALVHTIIGHELGHHGFGHTEGLPPYAIHQLAAWAAELASRAGKKSKEERQAMEIVGAPAFAEVHLIASLLSQVRELNADRAGILVEPDLMASIEAEMLLAAGAADGFGHYEPREYLSQAREVVALMPPFDDTELEATHPGGPLRALALEFFSETDLFRALTGRGSGLQKNGEFNKLLPRLVPIQALRPALSGYGRVSRSLPAFLVDLAKPPLTREAGQAPVTTAGPPTLKKNEAPAAMPAHAADSTISAVAPSAAPSIAGGEGEWADADAIDVVFDDAGGPINERERAELSWVLAARVVWADGKLTRGEENFMAAVVRPRALAEEVSSYLMGLSDAQFAARADELVSRARLLHGRSKTSLIRLMIQAAKADRKVEDDELRAIRDAAVQIDAAPTAERELRNVFGSRIDHL